jgi:hypothetical protein
MKFLSSGNSAVVLGWLAASSITTSTFAFLVPSCSIAARTVTTTFQTTSSCLMTVAESAMAESGIPPATADPSMEMPEDLVIPTNLPSECGMDYIPLATLLATGNLAAADQVSTDVCT